MDRTSRRGGISPTRTTIWAPFSAKRTSGLERSTPTTGRSPSMRTSVVPIRPARRTGGTRPMSVRASRRSSRSNRGYPFRVGFDVRRLRQRQLLRAGHWTPDKNTPPISIGPDLPSAGEVYILSGSPLGLETPAQRGPYFGVTDFGRFGASLAVGDFNGDSHPDLAIGAP